jgi:hypothetical protein
MTVPLTTERHVLGQMILCKGCCCGRTDRGLPEVPVQRIKEIWQREKLWPPLRWHLLCSQIAGCAGLRFGQKGKC